MKIARYWTKGRAEARSESGEPMTVTAWGWSALSREEAKQRADAAAQRVAARLQMGEVETLPHWYGYSDRPPREEIVREIESADGTLLAAITRNTYGTLVLNTGDLMFIDIDVPAESGGARFFRKLKSFFGAQSDTPESSAQKRIASLAGLHGEYTLRLYRTFAGFRCAITNRRISPNSEESRRVLEEFGADPLYVRLCQNQQSYRARLTPKYWRCGARRPPNRFPWATQAEEQRYRTWEQEYTEQCMQYATCRFVEQFGTQEGNAELRMLINLHDELTRAHTNLKLA